jgi:hypothetical protein
VADRGDAMSVDLRTAANDHLRDRRARGYVLADGDWLISAFLDGLAARGPERIAIANRVQAWTIGARFALERSWDGRPPS